MFKEEKGDQSGRRGEERREEEGQVGSQGGSQLGAQRTSAFTLNEMESHCRDRGQEGPDPAEVSQITPAAGTGDQAEPVPIVRVVVVWTRGSERGW